MVSSLLALFLIKLTQASMFPKTMVTVLQFSKKYWVTRTGTLFLKSFLGIMNRNDFPQKVLGGQEQEHEREQEQEQCSPKVVWGTFCPVP